MCERGWRGGGGGGGGGGGVERRFGTSSCARSSCGSLKIFTRKLYLSKHSLIIMSLSDDRQGVAGLRFVQDAVSNL